MLCCVDLKEVPHTSPIPRSKLPPKLDSLLEEFYDVMSYESNELPLLRNIQHKRDLVTRAQLPSLPHYSLNLKERKN